MTHVLRAIRRRHITVLDHKVAKSSRSRHAIMRLKL
jgi:hypothetical protein